MWYRDLQRDLGFAYEDMAGYFDGVFHDVLRGRLDLYVTLNDWMVEHGMADRLEAFVTYWFEHDADLDAGVLLAGHAVPRPGQPARGAGPLGLTQASC